MCKRSTADPLVRLFLDRYHLNLLPVPRERAACGQLYVKRGRAVSAPGDVRELFEPAVELPPVLPDEVLADIAGTLSEKVTVKVGLSLLESFLVALGAAGVVDKVKAGYQRSSASGARFRFADATRDSMDPLSLGTAFLDRRFIRRHAFVAPENRYYIVGAVVRTPSISILVEDQTSNAVDLGAEAMAVLDAEASVSAERLETGEIRYAGGKRLAIGVELYELRFDEGEQRLEMLTPEDVVDLRRGRPVAPSPVFLGEDDDAMLEFSA
jgi:hypothetical protein